MASPSRPRVNRTGSLAKEGSPRSPQTPLLGRSISSQFGSPGAFTRDLEEQVIYELGTRSISVGFAGEARPRCVHRFQPEQWSRPGDLSAFEPGYARSRWKRRISNKQEEDEHSRWSEGWQLYSVDLSRTDLQLVEERLASVIREIHRLHIQLDTKPRKAILVLPTLLPTSLVNVVLKVLFEHYAQPPSIQLLTSPIMTVVSAGARCGLVIDLGWEESVVSAVGEFKIVAEKRSIRGGKMLLHETARMLEDETRGVVDVQHDEAEDVVERMAWTRYRSDSDKDETHHGTPVKLPFPGSKGASSLFVPFQRLSDPAENTFFPARRTNDSSAENAADCFDEHDQPLPTLVFETLLSLPLDLRAACMSRIMFVGGGSDIPGLKQRVLLELQRLIDQRGWDVVRSYGTAFSKHGKALHERSANIQRDHLPPAVSESSITTLAPRKPLTAEELASIPIHERSHDHISDPISAKAEKDSRKLAAAKARGEVEFGGSVRGVHSLGAWAGASLAASMKIKGVYEIERDDFFKHGQREIGRII